MGLLSVGRQRKNRVDARAALEKNIYERYGSLQKRTSNARYDKRTTKKKHEPEYAYYSASTLNRIIRLVVAAVDE